jgi:hypothetical protein
VVQASRLPRNMQARRLHHNGRPHRLLGPNATRAAACSR